jgi:hypothetical protein
MAIYAAAAALVWLAMLALIGAAVVAVVRGAAALVWLAMLALIIAATAAVAAVVLSWN